VGVDTLPPLPKHAGDRNRTSPFAFTGNKFEFRAVGSSQSIAGPLVVLNTIVAESLDFIAGKLEKATGGDSSKLNAAVQSVVSEIAREHKAIIFNGNNYAQEWYADAEKRGLPNLRNTVSSLPTLVKKESIALFEKFGVLSERELKSRYEIYTERYCKDINSEALCALSMAKTMILPAAYRYQGELASTASALKAIGRNPHLGTLETVTTLVSKLEDQIAELEATINHKGGHDLAAEAKHYHTEVVPAMSAVREIADQLEQIVADDLWPLPTYREILFIK
jgi:glutamine synthetase